MRFLKFAALLALASVPLLLLRKHRDLPVGGLESDAIFEQELTVD